MPSSGIPSPVRSRSSSGPPWQVTQPSFSILGGDVRRSLLQLDELRPQSREAVAQWMAVLREPRVQLLQLVDADRIELPGGATRVFEMSLIGETFER